MSSENATPNVIRLNRPQSPHRGEPNPTSPSQEGEPFSSRQGSAVAPNVIQLNRPQSPHHGEPNPMSPSQEGDPFTSRQGSTVPNVIQLNRPQSLHHGEPNPMSPSQEGDPFSSRQGSPNRYPSNIDNGTGNVAYRDRESLVAFQDNSGLGTGHPLPPLPVRLPEVGPSIRRQHTTDTRLSAARRSNIDWIVPVESEKGPHAMTIGQRLQPTLDVAMAEKQKYETKARLTGYALNAAIGLQVLLGSLTTGLSAVSATGGKSAAVQTTILGGLATVVASYLARARGSNEPELSITRVKDLEQFIRECKSFQMDRGHIVGDEFDEELEAKRRRFEELLGNANGERRLSPV